MAIGYRAAGTVGTAITDPATSPGMPAGWQAGDLHILIVTSKAATPPTVTTPSGWLAPANNTITGGAGTVGATSGGPNRVTLFYREAVAGDTAPAIDLSAAASPTMAVILGFTKGAGETWDAPFCAVGADTTGSSTAYSVSPNPLPSMTLNAGDWLCTADALNDEAGTLSLGAAGVLQHPFATEGTFVTHLDSPTSTGNDSRLVVESRPITTGSATPSGIQRSFPASGAVANFAGCSVIFRLRATAAVAAGPVRVFDGVDDDLRHGIGGLSGMTYGTIAAAFRYGVGTWRTIAGLHTSGNVIRQSLYCANVSPPTLSWYLGGTDSGTTLQITLDVWFLVIARKATGTTTPRFSLYNYNTGLWNHQAGDTAVADPASPRRRHGPAHERRPAGPVLRENGRPRHLVQHAAVGRGHRRRHRP